MFDYLWLIVLVLLLLGGVVYFYYLYKTKGKDVAVVELERAAYELMLTAERLFNKKKAQEKLEWVIFTIIQSFPDAVEDHIDKNKSVEEVKAFVQNLYDEAKNKLKNSIAK